MTHLEQAKGLHLHINAGINDGHGKGSVPVSHSLRALSKVGAPQDRLDEKPIAYFTEKAAVPPDLTVETKDPSYGRERPLFRRSSGKATVTSFQGSHELVVSAAIAWLEKRYLQGSSGNEQLGE